MLIVWPLTNCWRRYLKRSRLRVLIWYCFSISSYRSDNVSYRRHASWSSSFHVIYCLSLPCTDTALISQVLSSVLPEKVLSFLPIIASWCQVSLQATHFAAWPGLGWVDSQESSWKEFEELCRVRREDWRLVPVSFPLLLTVWSDDRLKVLVRLAEAE